MSSIDLTTRARIRNSAVELFGTTGFAATTIRDIAAHAEVSPASVIHHFGTKDGLREAVDEWMYAFVDDPAHLGVLMQGMGAMTSYLGEHPELVPLVAYVTQTMRAGGPQADALFDRMLEITQRMSEQAVEMGIMRPTADEHDRSTVLLCYSLGVQLLSSQLARHLGGESYFDPAVAERYTRASMEILASGVLSPSLPTDPTSKDPA